ncbi:MULTISPECIES: universal stress protein [Rhodomicrobium]|uniref:universal stress protein n=1 Tax=Rhodomicrobium TaxID=1068 RepID=UPI000B4B981A|nr:MULTISPECIES: universal stress protein [Rhodomicrobium]
MIKDVLVRVEAGAADELRLAVAESIALRFGGRVIALFFNVLPLLALPADLEAPNYSVLERLRQARRAGDAREADLRSRLLDLKAPFEIHRHDAFPEDVASIAIREARTSDCFVTLRPNAEAEDPEDLVEAILFGGGRHLYVMPGRSTIRLPGHVLIAWNGSREAARAVAEAMPFMGEASRVTVLVIHGAAPAEDAIVPGSDLIAYLAHHGIKAELRPAQRNDQRTGATLIAEAERRGADLIVMGGYSHSRVREWLLGGATRQLLQQTAIPLLIAH